MGKRTSKIFLTFSGNDIQLYIQNGMKEIRWSYLKSERLKRIRGASFEELISSELVAIKRHPKREGQNIMLFKHKRYIWVVPYVEEKNFIFLKTLFPSRKYTKIFKKGAL